MINQNPCLFRVGVEAFGNNFWLHQGFFSPQPRSLNESKRVLKFPYTESRPLWVHHHHCLDSVQFSRSVMSDSLQPHELQHIRLPCPSPTHLAYPNSCPLSHWCHPTISSSVIPFSSCPQSFPASGSFQISQLFTSGGQSIGVSASTSVLPMNNFNLSTGLNEIIIQRSKIRIWINCKIS